MDLRQQVVEFRSLLRKHGFDAEMFELNVDSDAFRELLAGGAGKLEVHCRQSDVTKEYSYDGTPSWLKRFDADLVKGQFS